MFSSVYMYVYIYWESFRMVERNKLRTSLLKGSAPLLENIWVDFSIDNIFTLYTHSILYSILDLRSWGQIETQTVALFLWNALIQHKSTFLLYFLKIFIKLF